MSTTNDTIRLILHSKVTTVSIGEPVNPQLQAVNGTNRRVELGREFVFDWERLAFTEPNAVHLIGPDKADLALPYRRDPSYFSGLAPMAIAPGGEEWAFLPIYAHFHLRTVGKYRFWIELADDAGTVHKSNEIDFVLRDVEPATHDVSLTLQPASGEEVDATFHNRSDRPVVVLAPQEDSFYGWVNPVYQFTVRDDAGRVLPLSMRSGSMATPRYDHSTKFTIQPGAVHPLRLPFPPIPGLRKPGTYRVKLTYLVRTRGIGKAGTILDQQMNWDAGVFVGRIESNEITVKVP